VTGEIEPDMAKRRIYAEVFAIPFLEFERRWQEIEQTMNARARRAAKPSGKRKPKTGGGES
jgi:hypothetical protein